MERRRFLAMSATVTAGILAGCGNPGEDDEEGGDGGGNGGEEGGDGEGEEDGGGGGYNFDNPSGGQ